MRDILFFLGVIFMSSILALLIDPVGEKFGETAEYLFVFLCVIFIACFCIAGILKSISFIRNEISQWKEGWFKTIFPAILIFIFIGFAYWVMGNYFLSSAYEIHAKVEKLLMNIERDKQIIEKSIKRREELKKAIDQQVLEAKKIQKDTERNLDTVERLSNEFEKRINTDKKTKMP